MGRVVGGSDVDEEEDEDEEEEAECVGGHNEGKHNDDGGKTGESLNMVPTIST